MYPLFHGKKGGGDTMKPSSFQTTIENQFDYICKRAMNDEQFMEEQAK